MKKYLFVLFYIATTQVTSAQSNYLPLVEEGKVWHYRVLYDNSVIEKEWDEFYSIESDTTIGFYPCNKLYFTSNDLDWGVDHIYKGALYEKERKVYYIAPGNTSSTLLYDFSCREEDTVRVYCNEFKEWFDLLVASKKTVCYRDKSLTVIDWNPIDSWNDRIIKNCAGTAWIEGIGDPTDLLLGSPTWGMTPYKYLLSCTLNDEVIFELSEFNEKSFPVPMEETDQRYFRPGTKWTEIRLDTLVHDSWYTKVSEEWVPNFETVEYSVKPYESDVLWCSNEEYLFIYKVCTDGPGWTDSLACLLYEEHTAEDVFVKVCSNTSLAQAYQFCWSVGKELYHQEIIPFYSSAKYSYGIIDEIKEGDFGCDRSLKYVDMEGTRIVQGIGATGWNDGECIFGPVNLYRYSTHPQTPPERHYRSMLVHFERDGEVLYDVWPEKPFITEPVAFTAGQMATIILPTAPEASKGKYYRLDRVEGNEIIFEEELLPKAHVPYIIVPSEDFSIDLSTMDLKGLSRDTVSVDGVSFIGTFVSEELPSLGGAEGGFHVELIDSTPDCALMDNMLKVGALRAILQIHWDDPYNHGGTKVPGEKMQIVLHDHGTGIEGIQSSKFKIQKEDAAVYDLSGRKMVNGKPSNGRLPRGIYIKDGRKKVY